MNIKAQAEIWAIILGVIGAISSWIMADRMEYGIIPKIIITVLTFAVCYGIVRFMGSQ